MLREESSFGRREHLARNQRSGSAKGTAKVLLDSLVKEHNPTSDRSESGGERIAAFNGFTKRFIGFVRQPDDSLVFIDGLWSLTFGNNGTAGSSTTLFFTAGPNQETDGLFGTLTPVPAEQDGDEE